MTSRVFDFQRQEQIAAAAARSASAGVPRRTSRGLKAALLAGLLVVLLAGAADGPGGMSAAAASALLTLVSAAVVGPHIPWGVATLLLAAAGMAAPRQPWSDIGPALFAATVLAGVIWLATRDNRRRRKSDRPRPGTPGHAAQVMLGLSGERYVARVLANDLPQEYVLLNGLKLPRGAGDIDHVVVGPSGVFLLETKTMAGHIVCQADGTWRRTRVGRGGGTYDAYIGDPAKQVERNIFALRQVLRRRLPDLVSTTGLWLEGLVVFAHPRTELEASASRIPAVVLEEVTRRICLHVPRRVLDRADVDAIVAALLDEARSAAQPQRFATQSAQALAEVAVLLPVVLLLVFGSVGMSRVVQSRTAAIAVAHEAARAAALASSPADAVDRMRQRAELVAPGLGLDARILVLEWDVSRFDADPGQVVARVSYPVELADLPLVGGLPPVQVQAEHIEWVDPFRSGLGPQTEAAR